VRHAVLKKGYRANGKNCQADLDGYFFKPYVEGKVDKGRY
jgi:hypothetical protein